MNKTTPHTELFAPGQYRPQRPQLLYFKVGHDPGCRFPDFRLKRTIPFIDHLRYWTNIPLSVLHLKNMVIA